MYGIAIVDSGNYAMKFCSILEKKGFVFEVVSTPCQIAKDGCGYSIKFPLELKDVIICEGKANNIAIREIYKIVNMVTKNRYERVL